MSSERVQVKAKTRWRKSKDHAWHEKGETFMAPADWLPNPHLEPTDKNDDARAAD